MTQITLNVPDITCDHCDRTIRNALTPVAGVKRVAVDIPAKQVEVEYDPDRVTLDQIETILEEEDYPVAAVAPSGQTPLKENVPVATTLQTTAIDPVCSMSVDTRTARFTADYSGQTYYFCAPGCQRAFEQEPDRYLTARQEEPSAGCSCCGSSA
jgi:YHS domain-containing protein/copper chaperone CopZ